MTDNWKPVRVQGIERELSHEQAKEQDLMRELQECRERQTVLKSEREAEMKYAQRAVE